MKKYYILIGCCMMFLINVLPIQYVYSMRDCMNLMFLNIRSFPIYRIDTFNTQRIVSFLFMLLIMLDYVLNEINQYHSFLLMMMYRKNRDVFFCSLNAITLKKCVTVAIICYGSFVFLNICFYLSIFNYLDLLMCAAYFIKIIIFLFCICLIYNILALLNKNQLSQYIVITLLIFIIILEIFIPLNILFYSNDLYVELQSIFIMLVVSIFQYFLGYIKLKGVEDIL